ncbi:MAG: hypothetical protein K8L99_19125 [Anaerolineae bacterium]|nr:hypothetical protein [Anaerolineae bacterium]
MATEHELVSLLQGCLTCAPELHRMPIGDKILAAVARFNQAEALGFNSTAEMEGHQAWLKKHGTREYKDWLASFMPTDKEESR